jgi:hypothetical protein
MGKKRHSTEAGKEANTANEPPTTYANKRITFFVSVEEENEYTLRRYASMTPEARLAAVTHMRLTAYPYLNTNLKPWGNTLYFD